MMMQLEKINEKARRRRRSDPDFLQIPPPSKDQKTRQGGVSVAKGRDWGFVAMNILNNFSIWNFCSKCVPTRQDFK